MSEPVAATPPILLLGRLPRQSGWLLRDGRAQDCAVGVLLLFGLYAALFYRTDFPAPDFTALWSYGRMLREHPAADLYDNARLDAFHATLGLDKIGRAPFPYPPTFILLAWPLGLLPQALAFRAWIAVTVGAFVWAAAARRWRMGTVALLLLSPATTAGVISGQNGFLSAALMLGGLRLVGTRPWLGGLLIAMLTYKPQLGLLVPVALAAAGAWRGIAATCTWLAALIALTSLAFGPAIWMTWATALPRYADDFSTWSDVLWLQPTLLATMQLSGVPYRLAVAAQAALGCAMALVVWRAWRGGPSAPAIGTLVAATFVATPHAFFYDMPAVTAAVLYLGCARLRDSALTWWEAALLLLVLCLPAAMISSRQAISLPVLLAFVAWSVRPAYAAANCNSASRAYSPP